MEHKKGQFIFGRHPIVEALQAGQSIDKVLIQRGAKGPEIDTVKQLCNQAGIPIQLLVKERLDGLFRKSKKHGAVNHQGMAAFMSLVRYYQVQDVIDHTFSQGEVPLLLILDHITDVRNFGAIARSAAGMGVHGIIVPDKGSAQINAEAMKTSAGALNHIMICRERSIKQAIKDLQLNGIQVMASSLRTESYIHDLDLTVPVALVLGAEDTGISEDVIRSADQLFKIPMSKTVESFNVAVSAGMMVYEVARQRATFAP